MIPQIKQHHVNRIRPLKDDSYFSRQLRSGFSARYFLRWNIQQFLSDRKIWRPTHFESESCCLRCKWCSNKDVSRPPNWYVYELTARIMRVSYKINTHLPRSQFNKRTAFFFDVVTNKIRIRNTLKRKSRVRKKDEDENRRMKNENSKSEKKICENFVWNRYKIKSVEVKNEMKTRNTTGNCVLWNVSRVSVSIWAAGRSWYSKRYC